MKRSDIKFTKGNRVIRVDRNARDCPIGSKWIVEDVIADGTWITISSAIYSDDPHPRLWSFHASFFKLLMTCEVK